MRDNAEHSTATIAFQAMRTDGRPHLMTSDKKSPRAENTEDFVRLLSLHSREIYLCILGLVINRDVADDVFQETNLVLWREFGQFEQGTNFLAWAKRIAVNQVLAWRKRARRSRLIFSEAFLAVVADETLQNEKSSAQRWDALTHCLEKLPDRQRQLIALRYDKRFSIEEIAARNDKTIDAVYRSLSRIRKILHNCVTRRMALENND